MYCVLHASYCLKDNRIVIGDDCETIPLLKTLHCLLLPLIVFCCFHSLVAVIGWPKLDFLVAKEERKRSFGRSNALLF